MTSARPGAVIVTGAAHGIGAAIARRLAGAFDVVLADLDEPAARVLGDEITAAGGRCVVQRCDVRSWDQVERLCGAAERAFGPVWAVVAAAGLVEAGSLAAGDVTAWRAVVETNVLGTAHVVRAALGRMAASRAGHIVVIGSTSGLETYLGEPLYCASKWAVTGLTEVLRKEAAQAGVRVTHIAPGLVDTALSRSSPLGRAELERLEPLQPEDIAAAVEFALTQPGHVVISQIVMRPRGEE